MSIALPTFGNIKAQKKRVVTLANELTTSAFYCQQSRQKGVRISLTGQILLPSPTAKVLQIIDIRK